MLVVLAKNILDNILKIFFVPLVHIQSWAMLINYEIHCYIKRKYKKSRQ